MWKLLIKTVMSFDPSSYLDNSEYSSNCEAVKKTLMLAFSQQRCKCKNDIPNCVVQFPLNATLVYNFCNFDPFQGHMGTVGKIKVQIVF